MEQPTNDTFIPLYENKDRYLILKGGAGSGKSIYLGQKTLLRITTEIPHRFLITRKVKSTIRSSVYQLFLDLINMYGLAKYFNIHKSEFRFTFLPNGNEILLAGLDDPEKIKSIQGITSIWCEEMTEMNEEDFMQLDLRLRGETQHYKQIMGSFNPTDINHWIKKRFFDNIDSKTTTHESTFKDNYFLDDDYKNMLLTQYSTKENWYNIYVLNKWGKPTTGDEFYTNFKPSRHVAKVKYNKELPLHISFDFNVNPYMTCLVYQISGQSIYQIDEICLSHPRNRTKDVCTEFKRKYRNPQGLFIYGDPSGKAQDTRSEQGHNDYKIIQQELNNMNPIFRVDHKAPSIVMRGNFINSIFASNYDEIELIINESCNHTIDDLTYIKQDADGTKHKEKVKNKDTGITSEKYGHCSDSMDYFICKAFDSSYRRYQRGDSKVDYTLGAIRKSKSY